MDQDIVMTNGTIVSILGEVTLRDGITMIKMEMMDMDGISSFQKRK
jgi:hypothetical protein